MPTWKSLINGTLVLFLIVFFAYVGLAIYGVSRGEVKVADILVFLGGAAMMLLGMVVQSVRDAATKALEASK
jgi:hypothetical protein